MYVPGTEGLTAPWTVGWIAPSTVSVQVAPASEYELPTDMDTVDWPMRVRVGGVVSDTVVSDTLMVLLTDTALLPAPSEQEYVRVYVPGTEGLTAPWTVGWTAPSTVSVQVAPASEYELPTDMDTVDWPMRVRVGGVVSDTVVSDTLMVLLTDTALLPAPSEQEYVRVYVPGTEGLTVCRGLRV